MQRIDHILHHSIFYTDVFIVKINEVSTTDPRKPQNVDQRSLQLDLYQVRQAASALFSLSALSCYQIPYLPVNICIIEKFIQIKKGDDERSWNLICLNEGCVCVCVCVTCIMAVGERAALVLSAGGSTADWSGRQPCLTALPFSAVFSKHAPDGYGPCLPT